MKIETHEQAVGYFNSRRWESEETKLRAQCALVQWVRQAGHGEETARWRVEFNRLAEMDREDELDAVRWEGDGGR